LFLDITQTLCLNYTSRLYCCVVLLLKINELHTVFLTETATKQVLYLPTKGCLRRIQK